MEFRSPYRTALRHLSGALVILLGITTLAAAQPPEDHSASQEPSNPFEHVRFGAALEGFYQYNWNRPYDRINLLRAYDTRANVFGIQQAAIVVESVPAVDEGRRFGARVDLQFGQATETVQGSPANEPRPDVYRNIWQAYGTYVFPVGRGLQTDFGKFASIIGYETNYAKDNNQFSRAYLFNFLPFYHSGLRVTLPISDGVEVIEAATRKPLMLDTRQDQHGGARARTSAGGAAPPACQKVSVDGLVLMTSSSCARCRGLAYWPSSPKRLHTQDDASQLGITGGELTNRWKRHRINTLARSIISQLRRNCPAGFNSRRLHRRMVRVGAAVIAHSDDVALAANSFASESAGFARGPDDPPGATN